MGAENSTGIATSSTEFNPIVSITDDALGQPSRTLPVVEIVDLFRAGKHRQLVTEIRETFARVLAETGDFKAAKKAAAAAKKKLPGVMTGGFFHARGDKNLEIYSQVLCPDVDGLTAERVAIVYNQLARDPHCFTASVSPTGSGVKALCPTTGNAKQHEQSVAAMAKYFRETYGLEIDPACKNLERLCFASDNASDWNHAAIPFDPLPIEPKVERVKTQAAPSSIRFPSRTQIAEQILGAIQWTDESGFCKCPGEHLHTSANGVKDCKVMLDTVPTIKCFHGSCAGIVAGVNHELRSQIGKAERLAETNPNYSGIAIEYLGAEAGQLTDDLPKLVDAADFIAEPIDPPAELIEGILHKGSKLVLGGSSKTFKTWCLLDLAISVATGADWLGRRTIQDKVLFLNFEIQPHSWQRRIVAVAKAKGIELLAGQIVLWNLRGHAADFRQLIPRIIQRCRAENFTLIILDPIYKLYGGTDENAAGDVAALLNSLETLATQTGAAIAFGAHFAKGNASAKEAIDRISGSGVFARDPDSLLIFTQHETNDAFTVEPILRNFAPVDPFTVRWQYPLMELAADLDPSKLKKVAGRKKEYSQKKLLAAIAETTCENPISVSAWAHLTKTPRNTLSDYLPEMRRQKWIEITGKGNNARQFITNEGKAFINEK